MARPLIGVRTLSLVLLLGACTVGSAEPDGGVGAPDGASGPVRLELDPAEAVIRVVGGEAQPVIFQAIGIDLEGRRVYLDDVRFSLSGADVATVDDNGEVTATGRAGGRAELLAAFDASHRTITATAPITVYVEIEAPAPDVPADAIARFRELPEIDDPFGAPTLLYPLEGARMPHNVAAPDAQWHPLGAAGDTFRLTVSTEHATVRAFTKHTGVSFRSHLPLPPEAFRVIADSARGADVTLRVDRLEPDGEGVIRGFPVRIWLSEDDVFGTLYYWQVQRLPEASDVLRLEAATGERASVFETETGGCVGCHALSHDGRRLAATTAGTSPWATEIVDAASDAIPAPELIEPITPALNMLAFSPDGGRILASRPETTTDRSQTHLYLIDAADGRVLPAVGLPSELAGYPAWSPNGSLVAWMQGGGDGPTGTSAATRIVVADVRDGDRFEPRVLHDGGSLADSAEGGTTDSRPTFSPDSRFVVFAHGTSSISTAPSGVHERAGLYLVPAAGGDAIRLDRGLGRFGPVDAFWPVFSPFVTEEADGTIHYWLAFYSRQPYGNARAGTETTRRRQLWVMAIDPALAREGLDPSHPPYWLPGQDVQRENIAATWAPTACRAQGEGCTASSECCSGECAAADPAEPDVLTCQPPSSCRAYGESCESASDCCDGLECNLGVCGYEPPL